MSRIISKHLRRRIIKEYPLKKGENEVETLKIALEKDDITSALHFLKLEYISCLRKYSNYLDELEKVKILSDNSIQIEYLKKYEKTLKRRKKLYFQCLREVERFYKAVERIAIIG